MELNSVMKKRDMNLSPAFLVTKRDGRIEPLEHAKLLAVLKRACRGYEKDVSLDMLFQEIARTVFDSITTADLEKALVLSTASFIERDPAYSYVAARLLLQKLAKEVVGKSWIDNAWELLYRQAFVDGIMHSVAHNLLDQQMGTFDLTLLASYIKVERDDLLGYTGMQTLYERYLLRHNNRRLELPQTFFMRIAMGLALHEKNKNEKAISFYEVLSTLRYMPSTPTLFHAGFPVAQLSSCYLNTINDDLAHIFKCFGDNAQLSKWAGGIGTDFTNIRATGSYIKSIKATSQGAIPYLKIANDIVVAITKSGIRRGGLAAYMEIWHLDIEDFLDLRRNTGDERRRAHDMNIAAWIPDLFMKRVLHDQPWMLFSPHEVPDLHDLYGKAFEERYCAYERDAQEGKLSLYQALPAKQLWRKLLTRLFETGHPWITFKDPCNVRSPQDHVGVIHNSNLCTEITLNTSQDETAVCNLGSINLERHIINGVLDEAKLEETIIHAVTMLDNVIDLNFYPTVEAHRSNSSHRPIGLGLMGFQDALFKLNIMFDSHEALLFADMVMEKISYHAIKTSALLAKERGTYKTFKGSKWDRGIFPLDTLALLEEERGMMLDVSRSSLLDWAPLRKMVKEYGMRNSNLMAIAPTATIATIAGCYPCIEPIYKNIYVKSNVSGEFTVINPYLINDLKKEQLWGQEMLDQLKYYDGDLALMSIVPQYIKEKYKTAFELDAEWLVRITAVRAKWIDQSQSHNVFIKGVSGQKLHDVYMTAWKCGLKTTYYLRTLGASQIEKSTLDAKKFGFTQLREYKTIEADADVETSQQCAIDNPSCESCQ